MPIIIHPKTVAKLTTKHSVTEQEVLQCFDNRDGGVLMDTREEHKTNPPTLWFLAETNKGRLLKVCYVQDDASIHVKSAFEPNSTEISIYQRKGYAR